MSAVESMLQELLSTPQTVRKRKRSGGRAEDSLLHVVVACSVANVNLASVPTSLDGITLPDGCKVMLKNQTTASQKGVYLYSTTGPTLEKIADFEVDNPIMVMVERGSVFSGHLFCVNANNSVQLIAGASMARIKVSSGTDVATGIASDAKVTDGTIAAQLDTVLRPIVVSSVDKLTIRTDVLWTEGTNTKALGLKYNSTRTLWYANGAFIYG